MNEENEEIEDTEEEKDKLIVIPEFDENNNLNKDSKIENELSNLKNKNAFNLEKNNSNNENNHNSKSEEENLKNEIKVKLEEEKDNTIKNEMNDKMLKETNDVNEQNDNDNFKNNNIGNIMDKETYSETSISLNASRDSFNPKIFDQIKTFENYPSIDKFIINENNKDKEDSDKDILILEAVNYIITLNKMVDVVANQLRNLFQNITLLVDKIRNNIKFRILSINNTRLEIIINQLKNPNIINIKRKLIEILIFHLYDENSDYFENVDDYLPTIYNLRTLEELIRAKLKSDKNNENIQKDLNKILREKEKILDERKEKDVNITDDLENR